MKYRMSFDLTIPDNLTKEDLDTINVCIDMVQNFIRSTGRYNVNDERLAVWVKPIMTDDFRVVNHENN